MNKFNITFGVFVLSFAAVTAAARAVTIDLVPVGNPGNAPDPATGNKYGSVAYAYDIGKYEVTVSQYCEFLNAVARSADPYGLYNANMATWTQISQTWSTDHYVYAVSPGDWEKRPVNWVSWGDAARFVNWLANGQPTSGVENLSTTEDGSYYLNGATTDAALMAVNRKTNAAWALPSDNEWYKAAYYDPNKTGGAGYWIYPTRSDDAPSHELVDPDPGNSANYYDNGYTLGGFPYRTIVGEFEKSAGPYGTFDQGGNVSEWTDTKRLNYRGFNGGGFGSHAAEMASSDVGRGGGAIDEYNWVGFRVVYVPEPGIFILALSAAIVFFILRGKRWNG